MKLALKIAPFLILITAGLLYFSLKPATLTHAETAENVHKFCQQNSGLEDCYAKALAEVTKEHDMDFAFATLANLQKIDSQANGCHFIAHSITIAETKKNPNLWKEVMYKAPQNCSYGGAHGALEVYASTFPDGKLPESEVLKVCDIPDTTNCTHILGHLILVMKDNDIGPSLDLCKRLPHDERGIFECLTGVFMERSTATNLVEHGLASEAYLNWPARLPEIKLLCERQTGVDAVACWKESIHVALAALNYGTQEIVDFCGQAPTARAVQECENHAVGVISGSKNFELAKLGDICHVKAASESFRARCYVQLVASSLSTLPYSSPQAVRFCNSLPSPFLQECFTMIGNVLTNRSQDIKHAQQAACREAPDKYRNFCLNGGPTNFDPSGLD